MAGGNYGGNSIPTTPLNGTQVLALGSTTYKNYNCTSVIASAASATFTYEGQAIAVANGTTMDLLISPAGLPQQKTLYFCVMIVHVVVL